MQTNDILWKGIIETLIEDFLTFFYPDEVHLFDFQKGITFLDKELAQLFPERGNDARHVDKLIQIYLKNGEERWILIHIEIQGYVDKQFPERLFIYNHRIRERYQKDIGVLAIFTDKNRKYKPDTYKKEFLGTSHIFKYRTYKVLEQDEAELLQSTNPFAWVVLATLTALKKGKMDDLGIWQIKYNLVRLLYARNYPKEKIIVLFRFINYYIRFANSENTANFAKQISSTPKKKKEIMTTYEMILEEAKKEAMDLGIDLGIEKSKIEVVLSAHKKGITKELIAEIVQLPLAKVEEIIAAQQAS